MIATFFLLFLGAVIGIGICLIIAMMLAEMQNND
jgi:ABC-type phosphate transport system permease subunit